jgi:hypothetical protein
MRPRLADGEVAVYPLENGGSLDVESKLLNCSVFVPELERELGRASSC